MSRKFATNIDLQKNELQNAKIHVLSSHPSSPQEGQVYYNSTDQVIYLRKNSAWQSLGDASLLQGQNGAYYLARGNHTGTQPASTISDFDTQVRTSRLDQMAVPTADVSMNSHKITNVTAGTNPADVVVFSQLEQVRQGVVDKQSVAAVATANVNIASAPSSIDGYSLQPNDRVLLTAQTTGSQIGIYVFASAGAALTRADDADAYTELQGGAQTFALNGSTNGSKLWRQIATISAFTGQDWQIVGTGTTYVAGNGLAESPAGTFNVGTADTGRIVVNGNDIDLASGIATPGTYDSVTVDTYGRVTAGSSPARVGKYSSTIGNGSATSFTITQATHGLAASQQNIVEVVEVSTGDVVFADVSIATSGDVTIAFATAPTTNQYRVVIIG